MLVDVRGNSGGRLMSTLVIKRGYELYNLFLNVSEGMKSCVNVSTGVRESECKMTALLTRWFWLQHTI